MAKDVSSKPRCRVAKWIGLVIVGTAVACAAVIVWQNRRPPVSNAYYVALGSSYAAGFGLGGRAPGSPLVSMRSVNGYPQQLARLLKVRSFTDMTSSGSTMAHVLHGGQMMLGPQIDVLGPDTRLVTLTAGGNDIGYVGDLTAMAYRNRGGMIGAAIGLLRKDAKPANERDFAGLRVGMTATLREIGRRAPRADIVVVTYPVILPAVGTCHALGLTSKQVALMRTIGERLAQVTRSAAKETGATVVDMATSSAGHDACTAEPWVNGFKPTTGTDFHPTLAGALATAEAIAIAIR